MLKQEAVTASYTPRDQYDFGEENNIDVGLHFDISKHQCLIIFKVRLSTSKFKQLHNQQDKPRLCLTFLH